MELSKPHFWVPRPGPEDLQHYYLNEESKVMMIFVGIIVFLLLSKLIAKWRSARDIQDFDVLFLGTLFILLPLVTWIYSQFFSPLFLSRYFLIYQLGLTILMAGGLARVLPSDEPMERSSKFILTYAIGIMFAVLAYGLFGNTIAYRPPPGSDDADLPAGLPIVADNALIYLPRFHYNPAKRDYYYPWDSEVAFQPNNFLSAAQDSKVMHALKQHVPEQNVMTTEDFLNRFPEFIVLPSRCWLNTRIAHNPAFSMDEIRPGIFLVKRKPKSQL